MDKEKQLIADSKTFEQVIIDKNKSAIRAGFMVGGTGLILAGMSLVALILLLPLKETRVELYTVDNHTGRMEHVTNVSETTLTANEAYQKAMAANYVKLRERYIYQTLQEDYNTVQMFNSSQVNDDYLSLWDGKNAPDRVYRNSENMVKIEIISNVITDGTPPDKVASVRYKKIIRNFKNKEEKTEYWDAHFTFNSDPEKKMTDEEREVNPFGYTVTSWQRDREIRGGE